MSDEATERVAITACEKCGMPVRVIFDADDKITKVLAVCAHVKRPEASERPLSSQA